MLPRLLKIDLDSKHLFLFGPRGTGKTHWVKEHFKNALYIDLLNNSVLTPLLADPSRLETLIPPDFKDWIILDEVQKVPAILNEVHRLNGSALETLFLQHLRAINDYCRLEFKKYLRGQV